jgi:hypothetical protein
MSNKNVYEVFNDFRNAKTKKDRIDVLKKNDTWIVRQILLGAFHPKIQFDVIIPEYRKQNMPAGMSYSNMTNEIGRVYLFIKDHPRRPASLTQKRQTEILIQILEVLEEKEAEVFANMLRKDLKVPYLTQAIVNEAYEGLLPQS